MQRNHPCHPRSDSGRTEEEHELSGYYSSRSLEVRLVNPRKEYYFGAETAAIMDERAHKNTLTITTARFVGISRSRHYTWNHFSATPLLSRCALSTTELVSEI